MYKLVAVGGKIRGQEIILEEGTNTIGRGQDNEHVLSIEGISKKHMSITVNGETAFVEDLGSSNGTFINGKLIKKQTVKGGDKIALPNVIFQIVYVEEKKKIIKKKIAKATEGTGSESSIDQEVMPNDPLGKLKFVFKTKVMSVLYSFNEQYEWNVILGILIFLFLCTNIGLTIGPVLIDSRAILESEVKARGAQFASEVARTNAGALSRGDLDKLNTSFLDSEVEGVDSYELFDLEGRIVRPISKKNSYVNDSFSVNAINHFKDEKNVNTVMARHLSEGEVGIAKAILAYQVQTGRSMPVGIIAIKFKPKSLQAEAANNSYAYLKSLIITSIVGIIFFGMIYYLTIRPLSEMRTQIEEVLRGKRKELASNLLMFEIHPLRSTINSILQRIRELQNEDTGEYQDIEDDAAYIRTLSEFLRGAQGPAMVLNSEKLIEHLNPEGEDLTGLRESSASGTSLLDSARDQGFAATVIDLCDQSANNEGLNQSEVYELTGKNYNINVTALMGKDGFAKAFYVTFVLDE